MWSDWLVFCDYGFQSLCPWWRRIRGLWRLPDGPDWLKGKLGLVLMGWAKLSKSLTLFSVEGWGCVPSLLFDLRPNYGGGNEDNGDLLQKVPCLQSSTQCPQPCSRPPPTHTSARDSWTLTGKSGSVSCGVTASFSWVLVHTRFCLCPPIVCFPVLYKFWLLYSGINGNLLQEGLCHAQVYCTQSPCSSPLLTHTFAGDTQVQFCLSLWDLWVLVHTRFVWALWASLAGMGFHSKRDFTPPTTLMGLFLCP